MADWYSDMTIDEIDIGDQVMTKYGSLETIARVGLSGLVASQALVVDKGIDKTYSGGGWVRLSINGKNTVRISVQWVLRED